MAGYNRVVMIGNLTRDPDYKQLSSGQAVCRLGLATNRQFKNRQTGNLVQEVCYIDIDVWGPQAESCRQYLQKGRPVLIEGRLKFDSWEDTNGQTRSKHSIVADRVVFLANAQADGIPAVPEVRGPSLSDAAGISRNEQIEVERGILDQIDQIKNRGAKKATPKKAPSMQNDVIPDAGEISFTDQPPFEDDLPF